MKSICLIKIKYDISTNLLMCSSDNPKLVPVLMLNSKITSSKFNKFHRDSNIYGALYSNGEAYWYQNDSEFANHDIPAVIETRYDNGQEYTHHIVHYKYGKIHNDRGYAVEYNNEHSNLMSNSLSDLNTCSLYYQHGKLYREPLINDWNPPVGVIQKYESIEANTMIRCEYYLYDLMSTNMYLNNDPEHVYTKFRSLIE